MFSPSLPRNTNLFCTAFSTYRCGCVAGAGVGEASHAHRLRASRRWALYYSAAVGASFGATSSPSQTECQCFKKWFLENPNLIAKVVKFDSENPPIPHDDPLLNEWRAELKELKVRLTKEDRLRLPRGDYEHLWQLVQVMLFFLLKLLCFKKIISVTTPVQLIPFFSPRTHEQTEGEVFFKQ